MAIIQDPGNPQAFVIDHHVIDAMQMLDRMTPVNSCANEGLRSLKYMRQRYLQGIDKAKAEVTLNTLASISLHDGNQYHSSSLSTTPDLLAPIAASYSSIDGLSDLNSTIDSDSAPNTSPNFNPALFAFGQPAALSGVDTDQQSNFNFSFNPTLPVSDLEALWLTAPADSEAWPQTSQWLEGEMDAMQWQHALGL